MAITLATKGAGIWHVSHQIPPDPLVPSPDTGNTSRFGTADPVVNEANKLLDPTRVGKTKEARN